LEKTAKEYQIKLTGDLNSCEGCGMAMAKRKAIAKTTMLITKTFGERLFGDTAGPFTATLGGNRYIFAVVDDLSRYAWIGFGKKKTIFIQFVQKVIEKLKGLKYSVKYFRCDNAGENMKAITEVFDKEGTIAEHTPPYSPKFCESNETKWIPYLQPFGRIGVVTTKKSFKEKFKEKGTKTIIVG